MFEIPQLQFSKLSRYAPLVARVGLGFSMAYLAVLEKVLNPHWSEAVVQRYHLQSAVPVSAELWVLGAGLIELAVGLAILLGYRVRLFAAVAFGVLSVSFFFFNESVYSHVTLFATLSIIYILGSGKKN
jgi:uncharacterized membrane protein YphA (DoxX/SURF4 family)